MTNIAPGLRINEHVLDLRIGGGAFGEVWRAHHHLWQEHKAHLVAFKFPTNADYLRNLQQEGAAIRDLFHSNIVQAKGFDPFHDPPYLMMEYVPGTSLRALIRKGGLPPEQAVAILRGRFSPDWPTPLRKTSSTATSSLKTFSSTSARERRASASKAS